MKIALAASLLIAPLVIAQPTHDITLDDYFTLATPTSVALSPDASLIAYTEMRWDESLDRRNTDLWVADTRTNTPTRLTFDPTTDSNAAWSPDGSWIYFMSSPERAGEEEPPYDGSRQVWRMRPDGGEPQAVTRIEDGIESYELSADGTTLYYITAADHIEETHWGALKKEYSDLAYAHGVFELSTLHRLDLASWRSEVVYDSPRVITEFSVSPDESRIAMLTTPDRELITHEGWSWVQVLDAASGEVETLEDRLWREEAPSPFGWLLGLAWSDDSRALAFRIDFDGYPGELFVAEFGGGVPSVMRIDRPDGPTLDGGDIVWRPGSRDLAVKADDLGLTRVFAVENVRNGRHGAFASLTPGDVVVGSFSFAENGTLAVIAATPESYKEIHLVSNGTYTQISNLNPHTDNWKKPQVSIVTWEAPDGKTVEGILELPYGHDPQRDGALPLVVNIHGGPTSATPYSQRFWIYGRTLFPAKGWAMLSPNYRGSTGYGDAFLTDLIGRENDIEVTDILAGVDAMVERGIADETRMAVMGWSNGGFLTNAIITTTDRFKAASSGAGAFDQNAQWMLMDTPGHVVNYMDGKLPWEDLAEYDESSPMAKAGNISTPTVIHVGEKDERVPAVHSIALHRAMKHYLDVPVELVIYPGAGHGLTTYTHRKAKMAWDHAWFDHWVMGTE